MTGDLNATSGHRPIKKGGAQVLSQAAQMRLSFPYATFCLSYYVCPIRPCGAPFPRGEGYDTRNPSSKKGGEAATRALNLEP